MFAREQRFKYQGATMFLEEKKNSFYLGKWLFSKEKKGLNCFSGQLKFFFP
jgi:hypothetical protein